MPRVKPYVKELSLAFDPCNRKRFLMIKENSMEWLKDIVEVLETSEPLLKEDQLDALFKEKKMSEAAQRAVKSALRILGKYKDELPPGIFSSLSKAVPEYGTYAQPEKSEKDGEMEKKCKEPEGYKEDKMTKDIIQKMQKDLEEAKASLIKANEALQMEKDARRVIEIKTDLDRSGVIGNTGEIAKKILSLEKADPQLANDVVKMHKDAAQRLAAAGLMDEVGSSHSGIAGSAYHQLRAKHEELLKKDKSVSPTKAWKQVIRENPDLYKQYTAERT